MSRLGAQWLELDLHFLSLGGGEVALQWWFEECLVPYFNSEKLAAVKTVHIVTGYGKTRWRGAREGDDGMRKRIRAMLGFMNIHEFEQPNKGRIHIDKALLEKEVARNHGRIVFDQEGYNKFKADQTTANQMPTVEQKVRPSNPPTRTGEIRPRYNQDRDPRGGFRGRDRGGPGRGFAGGRGGPGRHFDGPNRDHQGVARGSGGQVDDQGRDYRRQQPDHNRYGPPDDYGNGRDGNYGAGNTNDRYSGGYDERQGYSHQNEYYGGQQSYNSQPNSHSNDYQQRDRSYNNSNQDRGSFYGGQRNDSGGYSQNSWSSSRGGYQGGNAHGDSHGYYGSGSQGDDRLTGPSGHYGPGSHGDDRKRPYDESFEHANSDQRGYDQPYKRQARY